MSNTNVKKMKKERIELLEELSSLSDMLHASWVERYSVCSNPDCRCHRGERHGPRRYVVVNEDGKQRQKYIPNSQVKAARRGVEQYKRLQEIADRITSINIKLIREREYDK